MASSGIQDSLRERGVRLTRQRRLLLDLIDNSGLHLDAESLFQMAKEKDPKLNRVTVYRTLKLLKEGGLVDELDLAHFDGEKHYYETRLKQEHAHVICLRCGRVEEFFGEQLKAVRGQMQSHFGFEIVFARTEIGGYCSHCQALRAKEDCAHSSMESSRPSDECIAAPLGSRTPAPVCRRRLWWFCILPASAPARPSKPLPFLIGRQADNNLVLRDNRASRTHARIIAENGQYVLEDLASRHGTCVNGQRVTRHVLRNSDRIDLGVPDSYQLTFTLDAGEINRILEQISSRPAVGRDGRQQPGQTALAGGSGPRAAKLAFDARRADRGGGRGSGRHRLRARIPAAAQGRQSGSIGIARSGRQSRSTRAICACRPP